MEKYKIHFFFILILGSSCSLNKIVEQSTKPTTSAMSAEITTYEDRFSITLHNNSNDTLVIGTSLAAHGFHAITADESGKVVHDTRNYNFYHATDYLLPNQSKPFVQKNWMYDDYFFGLAKIRKSGNYTITFFHDEYGINENFTVYFDFENFYEDLKNK